jgi:hypothetical protein
VLHNGGHAEVARLPLENGASPLVKTDEYETTLSTANLGVEVANLLP